MAVIYVKEAATSTGIIGTADGTYPTLSSEYRIIFCVVEPKCHTQMRVPFPHELPQGGFCFAFSAQFCCSSSVLWAT